MLFGLKAEGFGLHAGSHPLEGISRSLEAEGHFLEPGEPGLEGEEQVLKGEEQALKGEGHFLEPGEPGLEAEEPRLKAEELFFERPEPGLQEMRHSLQPTALVVAVAAWQPAQGVGFPARLPPSAPRSPSSIAPPCVPCLPVDDFERPSFPEIMQYKQRTPPRVVARTCTCFAASIQAAVHVGISQTPG